jgi:hypothetical protein
MDGRSERGRVRDLIDQVRRILLEVWDPLGVGGMPGLSDEYDFVLGKVMSGLANQSWLMFGFPGV